MTLTEGDPVLEELSKEVLVAVGVLPTSGVASAERLAVCVGMIISSDVGLALTDILCEADIVRERSPEIDWRADRLLVAVAVAVAVAEADAELVSEGKLLELADTEPELLTDSLAVLVPVRVLVVVLVKVVVLVSRAEFEGNI